MIDRPDLKPQLQQHELGNMTETSGAKETGPSGIGIIIVSNSRVFVNSIGMVICATLTGLCRFPLFDGALNNSLRQTPSVNLLQNGYSICNRLSIFGKRVLIYITCRPL